MLEAILIIGVACLLLGAYTLDHYLKQAEADRQEIAKRLNRLSHIELKLHQISLLLEDTPLDFPPALVRADVPCDLDPVPDYPLGSMTVRERTPAPTSAPTGTPAITHFPRRANRIYRRVS